MFHAVYTDCTLYLFAVGWPVLVGVADDGSPHVGVHPEVVEAKLLHYPGVVNNMT